MTIWNSNNLNPQDIWITQLSVLPASIYVGTCVSYGNDSLYFMGGNVGGIGTTSTNYLYTISTDTWTTKNPINYPSTVNRQYHCSSVVGQYIYVIGGYDGSSYVGTTYQYNTSNDTWAAKASLPGSSKIGVNMCFTYGNYIYVMAGFDGTNYTGGIWKYDTVGNSWDNSLTTIPDNYKVSFAAGGIVDDNIFVIVGYATINNGSSYFYSTRNYRYNITSNSWTRMKDYPFSYGVHYMNNCCFTFGKYIYVLGGQNGSTYYKNSVRYNTKTDVWEYMVDLPQTMNGAAGAVSGNKGFLVGGWGGVSNARLNTNYMYLL